MTLTPSLSSNFVVFDLWPSVIFCNAKSVTSRMKSHSCKLYEDGDAFADRIFDLFDLWTSSVTFHNWKPQPSVKEKCPFFVKTSVQAFLKLARSYGDEAEPVLRPFALYLANSWLNAIGQIFRWEGVVFHHWPTKLAETEKLKYIHGSSKMRLNCSGIKMRLHSFLVEKLEPFREFKMLFKSSFSAFYSSIHL